MMSEIHLHLSSPRISGSYLSLLSRRCLSRGQHFEMVPVDLTTVLPLPLGCAPPLAVAAVCDDAVMREIEDARIPRKLL
jgi:hypothetical protein